MELTAEDLQSMRAEAALFLPESGTIYRVVGAGTAGTLLAHGTASCRVAPLDRSAEALAADRSLTLQTWLVTFAGGTDVRAEDQIRSGGRLFEVDGLAAPRSWEVTRRVVAREVLSWPR